MDGDIVHFSSITGADKKTAEKLIREHGGDVNKAFDAYYNRKQASSHIMTLDDLKRRDEALDAPASQRFYAGGEKSGMFVEGRPEDSDKGAEAVRRAVQSVFGKAQNLDEDVKEPQPFKGKAHKLNDEDCGCEHEHSAEDDHGRDQEIATRNVIFWQNGLTIENGPFRPYSDQSTARLLEQLNSNQAPLRDFGLAPGQPVDIKVAHCLDRPFTETDRQSELAALQGGSEAKQSATFTGSSHKLTDMARNAAPSATPGERLHLDSRLPTTRLQLRLANGQRYESIFIVG